MVILWFAPSREHSVVYHERRDSRRTKLLALSQDNHSSSERLRLVPGSQPMPWQRLRSCFVTEYIIKGAEFLEEQLCRCLGEFHSYLLFFSSIPILFMVMKGDEVILSRRIVATKVHIRTSAHSP